MEGYKALLTYAENQLANLPINIGEKLKAGISTGVTYNDQTSEVVIPKIDINGQEIGINSFLLFDTTKNSTLKSIDLK